MLNNPTREQKTMSVIPIDSMDPHTSKAGLMELQDKVRTGYGRAMCEEDSEAKYHCISQIPAHNVPIGTSSKKIPRGGQCVRGRVLLTG